MSHGMALEASFIVSAKPLPPTARSSSAGSSNLGTSLYPAHKARDVGDVVLAETMNQAALELIFFHIVVKMHNGITRPPS